MNRALDAVAADDDDGHVAGHNHQIAVVVAGKMRIADAHRAFKVRLDERLIGDLRRAADVERAHGELGARLADGLRRNDADRLAHVDRGAARQIASVAIAANAVLGFAGQYRADLHFLDAGRIDRLDMPFLDHRARGHDDLAVDVDQILSRRATKDAARQRGHDRACVHDGAHTNAALRSAITFGDDRILRNVHETTRQIARVRGLQRGVGKTLAGAVGRVEVFENREAFFEVRDDRSLDDLARGLGHQAAHGGELAHLGWRTARARMRHHVDRVDRLVATRVVLLHGRNAHHHLFGELVRALGPGVDHLVVLLALRDEAVVVLLLVFLGQRLRRADDGFLRFRHDHVVLAEGNAGLEGFAESQSHDAIAEDHRLLLSAIAVDGVDHRRDFLLRHEPVGHVEGDFLMRGKKLRQNHAARRRLKNLGNALAVFVIGPGAALDLRMQRDRLGVQRMLDLGLRRERHALPDVAIDHEREIIQAQNDILRWHDDRLTIGRMQNVVRRHHQHTRFQLRFKRQRNVYGHLVAVEVGVERGANQRMQLDRLAFDQHRLERLNAEAMERGRAVEQDRMLADNLVEDVPDFRLLFFNELLGLLHGGRETLGVEARIDERLEQLQRHLLGQAALMQLQFRTHHDNGAARIIDALAEQVLAEAALLALEHVGERLQRALVGAGDDAAATTIVEQRIHRFLKHALLVADDDVRRAQFDQPLQAVVAVDDAAVKIVQVGRGETSAVERHQRAQIGRNDGHFRQHHPLGLVARIHEGFDDFEALGQLLWLQLAGRFSDLDLQIGGDLGQIHVLEQLADRFCSDERRERILAVLVLRAQELVFREELTILERRQAGVDDDVGFEIENALKLLERHVHQEADARG